MTLRSISWFGRWILPLIGLLTGQVTGLFSQSVPWGDEIELLGRELTLRHPDPFFRIDSTLFFHELEKVAEGAAERSLFDTSVKLQQVVALLGDPNTRINFHFNIESRYILPLSLYWFEEGLMVLETQARYGTLLGKKVISINNSPVEVIADSLSTLLPPGCRELFKEEFPRMVTWTQLLEYFGFGTTSGYNVGYEDLQGNTGVLRIEVPVTEEEPASVSPSELPLGWSDRKSYFSEHYFPDQRLYYIQYNKCWSRETEEKYGTGASALFMPSFRDFEKIVMQTVRQVPIDRLVMDLRFNDGGHPEQGSAFFRKLQKSRFADQAQFFLIVGRKTKDAGLVNAMEFMQWMDAVVAGEPTGGRPNHFGDIQRFVLPESNLIVDCSTRYYRLMEEDPPALEPDLMAPMTFRDYMKGSDPAVDAIKSDPRDAYGPH